MKYYAKVNTAAPGVGLVTVGEVLTERQAAALGEEKIAELIRDGVLGACGGGDAEAAPGPAGVKEPETGAGAKAEPAAKGKEPETGAEANAKPAAKGTEPEPEEEPEEDEELPELGMPEDIVRDEPDTRTDAKATAEADTGTDAKAKPAEKVKDPEPETGTAKKGGRRKAK